MAKYNGGRRLKKSYTEEIESYFSYYWAHDKLYFLQGDTDIRFWDELPSDIKIQIFQSFLFRGFIRSFRKLFEIQWIKHRDHSVYKWDHDIYQDFMIEILKSLVPRKYSKHDVLQ